MILKLRKLCTGEDKFKFLFSIYLGFLSEALILGLIYFFVYYIFLDVSFSDFNNRDILLSALITPFVLLIFLFYILKRTKINNPYLISISTGLLSVGLIYCLDYYLDKSVDLWFIIPLLISIPVLIFIWIILVQTSNNLTKSLSVGFFVYLLITTIIQFIQKWIIFDQIQLLSFILTVCFIGIITWLFELVTRMSFRFFRLL